MDIKPNANNILVRVEESGIAKIPTRDVEGTPLQLYTDEGVPLVPMKLQLQKTIDSLPYNPTELYSESTKNDGVTVSSWKPTWIGQCAENRKHFDFDELSCMSEYEKESYKPVIIAGSGPSLKKNAYKLKEHKVIKPDGSGYEMGGGRRNIRIVSCLHNFGFFEDMEIMTKDDYYLTLDSGPITIPEMTEGGKRTEEEYWELTKDRTLVAVINAHPELLRKWKGRIIFFMVPSTKELMDEYTKHLDVTKVPGFSVGGNALGACLYFAKAVLGAGPIIFVGADFSFGYDHRFHSWNSQYDKQFAGLKECVDIYGNRVYTWPSYFGFAMWFNFMAMGGMGNNPQMFINATEGGILGAFPEGNIKHIIQMDLYNALRLFTMHHRMGRLVEMADRNPMVLF